MNVALPIIAFIVGFIVGAIISTIVIRRKYSKKSFGSLKVDYSDPDGPYMFLSLNTDIQTLSEQDYVILGVDISQK